MADSKYSQNPYRERFSISFKSGWNSVASFEIAVKGFRGLGLFLLDSKGTDLTKFEPSKVANPVSTNVAVPRVEPDTSIAYAAYVNTTMATVSTPEPVCERPGPSGDQAAST